MSSRSPERGIPSSPFPGALLYLATLGSPATACRCPQLSLDRSYELADVVLVVARVDSVDLE